MASLLFINQHYHPDVASTGQHLTDLAEYLASRDHDVNVLCGKGSYTKGFVPAPDRETQGGVHIRRVATTHFGRKTHLGRIIDYASFYVLVLLYTLMGRKYDYVITLTTPPMLGLVGTLLRILRKQRYGIWSMDLHPDAEVAVGMLKEGGMLTRVLQSLNNYSYRRADFVVALGPYMRERIVKKGVDAARIYTIGVWSSKEDISPVRREDNALADELELQGKFTIMYSGNAGLAHQFDEVMEAMVTLKDHPDMYFLFVGNGPQKERIKTFAAENHIHNFRYMEYFKRERLQDSINIGDVHILTLRNDMAGISVPCKLYGIMAAGRPVVMVGPRASESGDTIVNEGIGVVIDPESVESSPSKRLVDVLHELYEEQELREQMGIRSHLAFIDRYDRELQCQAWASLIEKEFFATYQGQLIDTVEAEEHVLHN